MGLVRVARIADLTEAKVIASALEAADIPAFVQNGEIGQTYSLLQPAIGGFGIMVSEDQAPEAAAFIRDHRSLNPEVQAAFDEEDEAEDAEAPGEETWAEGRVRRRHNIARWLIVTVFIGPALIGFIVLMAEVLLNMLAGVLGG
jgi:hypothetical protein